MYVAVEDRLFLQYELWFYLTHFGICKLVFSFTVKNGLLWEWSSQDRGQFIRHKNYKSVTANSGGLLKKEIFRLQFTVLTFIFV